MITDYNKYIEELDKIKNERTVLQHQDYVLSKKEIDTEIVSMLIIRELNLFSI